MSGGDDFGVYVHWPFCAAKCPYCDFNSHVVHGGADQEAYLAAYLREINHVAELAPGRTVGSIFFGGGTPSLMKPAIVSAILDAIARHWQIARDVEVTLEANPSSVEASRFAGYRAAGVNRVSLGVQSLDDAQLRFLGRLHSAQEAIDAVALAQRHFDRVSIDLIYARPGQKIEEWEAELGRAIALGTGHLSLYQLTIEPGTPFHALRERGRLSIPEADLAAELFELTREITQNAGLPAYEVSNHAAPSGQCRHNLIYWRGQDYAGIGPGAHGRLTIGGSRFASENVRMPGQWREQAMSTGHGMAHYEALTDQEAADEILLMGLRLLEGLPKERYERRAGRSLNREQVRYLRQDGFIEEDEGGVIRATAKGVLVLNTLVASLAA